MLAAAAVTSLTVALAKGTGMVMTRSGTLAADTAFAATAVVTQGSAWIAFRRRRHRTRGLPAPRHPDGRRINRMLWPLGTGILLFATGAGALAAAGTYRLVHPPVLSNQAMSIGVTLSVAALLLEAQIVVRTVLKAGQLRDASWWTFLRDPKQPVAPWLLIQTVLSCTARLVACVAAGITATLEAPGADTGGMIGLGGLMAVATLIYLVGLRTWVIGHQASRAERQAIAAAIDVEPCVARLTHLEVHSLGPGELLVGARVDMTGRLDLGEVARALDRLESSVRRTLPAAKLIYIEPDLWRCTASDRGRKPTGDFPAELVP